MIHLSGLILLSFSAIFVGSYIKVDKTSLEIKALSCKTWNDYMCSQMLKILKRLVLNATIKDYSNLLKN